MNFEWSAGEGITSGGLKHDEAEQLPLLHEGSATGPTTHNTL